LRAKNGDAVGQVLRGVAFAGKPRSYGAVGCLRAKNDGAVGRVLRGVAFAGKPRSYGAVCAQWLSRAIERRPVVPIEWPVRAVTKERSWTPNVMNT
jgi:hypothetical protein